MSITVIINPIAGGASPASARARADRAASLLRDREARVRVTERAGQAREFAADAVARGDDRVIVWGGDGTLNEVVRALAFTPLAVGIVPAGSGNGFASELGLPGTADAAFAVALTGVERPIDVGEIAGRLFVNVAGIGIDAHVAAAFNSAGNTTRGLRAYTRIGAGAILRYRPRDYTIETTARRTHERALIVALANSAQWGHGARIAPGALPDDGLLDVVVVTERSRLTTLRSLPRLFDGTLLEMPGCTIDRAPRVAIECDEPMPFHVDGEPVMGGTRLEARIHPRALRVIAGRARSA